LSGRGRVREGEGCRVEGSMGVTFNVESHEAEMTDSRDQGGVSGGREGVEREDILSSAQYATHLTGSSCFAIS